MNTNYLNLLLALIAILLAFSINYLVSRKK